MIKNISSHPTTGKLFRFGAAFVALTAVCVSASAYDGYHELKIKTRSNAHSAYVSATLAKGAGTTYCIQSMPANAWWGSAYVKNGTGVTLQEFTSTNCTAGDLGKKYYTVPGNDGLNNFWITY